ncbi:MAG: arylsulfatase [Candidatus Latescibacterota bacterium]|nr:arylsulfatase [Candidatus Latescibacterota bacterium]
MARYRKPHLLLITTDQQRGDCLGCEGHPAVETPYVDQIAEKGARFRHAYTSVPSCTPARAGIITGMDPWNHGRLTMTGNDPLDYPATLPGELSDAGYHTRLVGKAHHAPQRTLQGFHDTCLDESGRRDAGFISDYHAHFDRAKEGEYGYRDHSIEWNSWMARPSHLPEHLHPTYWTASEAIRAVETRDPTRPLFLWMSFARPHSPYDPPQAYWDMYVDHPHIPAAHVGDWAARYDRPVADVNAPRTRRSDREIHRGRAGYYGNISFIDHQIGRVLYEYGKRDPEGLANTLIVFTSDHGDMMGDHHHWRKTYPYEGSARIPFVVQWPTAWGEDVARGQVLSEPIELRDIMPTFLDAAGLDAPDSVDGESLLSLCNGTASEWRPFVQGEHTQCYDHENCMQYVTDGDEKYIWFHHIGEEQFFDLRTDPHECHDLTRDPRAAERIDVWRKRLAQVNEERGDPRGQGGQLVPQPEGALRLSPNYSRWRDAAAARMGDWQGS